MSNLKDRVILIILFHEAQRAEDLLLQIHNGSTGRRIQYCVCWLTYKWETTSCWQEGAKSQMFTTYFHF